MTVISLLNSLKRKVSASFKKNRFAFYQKFRTLHRICFILYYVLYLQLLSEVVGHYGSKGAEQRCQEDADITDVNGDVKKV